MIKYSYFKRTFWCASVCLSLSINAATKYVANLLDDGSPGTLRQTIASANSGDTILFAVSGTIFLEAANGELVIDKTLTINGEDNIIIDGQNNMATGLHIVAGGGDTQLESFTLQNFADTSGTETGDVYGILIDNGAPHCSVNNCTIKQLLSSNLNSGIVNGILAADALSNVIGNTVTQLTRGDDAAYQGGGIVGIQAAIQGGVFSNNTVSDCKTGNSSVGLSGSIKAIVSNVEGGSFSNNTVSNCKTGNSTDSSSGSIEGVKVFIEEGSFSSNIVSNCRTGNAAKTSGSIIAINANAQEGLFFDNTISDCITGYSISESSGDISGIILQAQSILEGNLFTNNTVSNCSTGQGSSSSGFIFAMNVNIDTEAKNGLFTNNMTSNCSTGQSNGSSGIFLGINALITSNEEFFLLNNTINNCSTGISSDASGVLEGILLRVIAPNLSYFGNSANNLVTGNAETMSGILVGMEVQFTQKISCINNNASNLSSGIALESGTVQGLRVDARSGSEPAQLILVKNNIESVFSGEALSRGNAQGIYISCSGEDGQVSCNTIRLISGGENTSSVIDNTVGLKIDEGNQLSIKGNSVSEITGEHGQFTTGMQLGGADIEGVTTSVTNSTISHNTVKNISDTTSGFGITILGENSNGNSILSNSIFGTTNKAINILNNFLDGEDISSFTDAIVTLSSVVCTNNKKIKVTGTVEPQMGLDGQSFLLQFFVSDTNPPAQAKTLIFEYLMTGSEDTNFELTFTPAVSTNFGQYISATATAQVEEPAHNWNTSEVSNALPACNSSGAPYSPFICPDVPITPLFDCDNCPLMPENGDAFDIL